MRPLSDQDQLELLLRLRALEHENAHLRAAIARAYCGHVLDFERSCQLGRNHDGLHAWVHPTEDLIVRW